MNVYSIPYPGHEEMDLLIPVVSLGFLAIWGLALLIIKVYKSIR